MGRGKLLDIAVREFGLKGLEGVSTRDIAAAAGTAMSSITYHYGGKEGLYLAAADHIAAQMGEAMAPAFACDPAPADPVDARRCLHELLDHFAVNMLPDDEPDWSMFIMREQMHPTDAFERLVAGPIGRIAERLAALIAVATGADETDARITAMLLFGQVTVWRTARALAEWTLARRGVAIAPAIRQRLAANVDAILDRLIAEQQEPR